MQKKQTHLPYAIIIALLMVVFNVIIILTHHSSSKALGYLVYLPLLVGVIMNAQAFSKANNEQVTFGQDFMSCFKATLIVAAIYCAWAFAAVALFPQMKAEVFEAARQEMAKRPNVSQDGMDMAMNIMDKGFVWIVGFGSLIGILFIGTIFSLIAAAVAKKNPQQAQLMA